MGLVAECFLAISSDSSATNISGCLFNGSVAISTVGSMGMGGALYVYGPVEILGSSFVGSSATMGGAIRHEGRMMHIS